MFNSLFERSVIADEQFDALSDYVITKPSLADKIITLYKQEIFVCVQRKDSSRAAWTGFLKK